MVRLTAAVAWLPIALLAGCATQGAPPALPETHPAHPGAATVEPIQPSGLLRRAAPIPAAAPELPGAHDHHAHGMGEAAPPGRPEESPPAEEHEHPPREPAAHEHHDRHDPEEPPPGPAR